MYRIWLVLAGFFNRNSGGTDYINLFQHSRGILLRLPRAIMFFFLRQKKEPKKGRRHPRLTGRAGMYGPDIASLIGAGRFGEAAMWSESARCTRIHSYDNVQQ